MRLYSRRGNWTKRLATLAEALQELSRLLSRSDVLCLHLVEAFEDGETLFRQCEAMALEGVVSKRRDAPYVSGMSKTWRKTKTKAWRGDNIDRWRSFVEQRR